jgi:hypothetical protein
VRLVVIGPWKNPRSKGYWFRRRVPAKYRRPGMPAEIKFSLGTTDLEEAKILCQEENLKLERRAASNLRAMAFAPVPGRNAATISGSSRPAAMPGSSSPGERRANWQIALRSTGRRARECGRRRRPRSAAWQVAIPGRRRCPSRSVRSTGRGQPLRSPWSGRAYGRRRRGCGSTTALRRRI